MMFVDQLLLDHYQEWQLDRHGIGRRWSTVLVTPRFVTSRHVVALVYPQASSNPRLVVKIPRQPGDNGGVGREANLLRQLAQLHQGGALGAPEVVGTVELGSHLVLAETAVTGAELDPVRVLADRDTAVRAGVAFVADLPVTCGAATNGDWYERTISVPLKALTELVDGEEEVVTLAARTHDLLAPLRSVPLPAVFEHADLSHPNLFLHPDGRLQAVDWERASTDGLPGHDLVFYLQYLGESVAQAFSRPSQLVAYDAAYGADGWARPLLREHLRLRGVDPDLAPFLVVAAWARSASTLADRLRQDDTHPSLSQVRAAVAGDRDYWLWRYALTSTGQKSTRVLSDP